MQQQFKFHYEFMLIKPFPLFKLIKPFHQFLETSTFFISLGFSKYGLNK